MLRRVTAGGGAAFAYAVRAHLAGGLQFDGRADIPLGPSKAFDGDGDGGGEQATGGFNVLGKPGAGDGDKADGGIVVALGMANDDFGGGPADVVKHRVGGGGAFELLEGVVARPEGIPVLFCGGEVFLPALPVFAMPGCEVGIADFDLAVGQFLDLLCKINSRRNMQGGGFRRIRGKHELHVAHKI